MSRAAGACLWSPGIKSTPPRCPLLHLKTFSEPSQRSTSSIEPLPPSAPAPLTLPNPSPRAPTPPPPPPSLRWQCAFCLDVQPVAQPPPAALAHAEAAARLQVIISGPYFLGTYSLRLKALCPPSSPYPLSSVRYSPYSLSVTAQAYLSACRAARCVPRNPPPLQQLPDIALPATEQTCRS